MKLDMFQAAMIQLTTGQNISENVDIAIAMIKDAAQSGAQILFTPEMTSLLDNRPGEVEKKAQIQEDDFALKAFQECAAKLKVVLHIGSIPILKGDGKLANRSFCINPSGRVICWYDKIHMFDADLPNNPRIRESEKYTSGENAAISETPYGKIGMTICYDMRFPGLYTDLAVAGSDIFAIPSSFTVPTGKAHWHVLLRARAIENGCYVAAAAQCGLHEDGRMTYGHSLAVNPWGEIVGEADKEPAVVLFKIDLDQVKQARRKIPNLQNRRSYKKAITYPS